MPVDEQQILGQISLAVNSPRSKYLSSTSDSEDDKLLKVHVDLVDY